MLTRNREMKDIMLASPKNLKWGYHTASLPFICRERLRSPGTKPYFWEKDEEKLPHRNIEPANFLP